MSEELLNRLSEVSIMRSCARRTHLLRAGQICRSLYFVESGLFRRYYVQGKKDISSGFMKEGDICVVPESFFTQRPSTEYIEALESGVLSAISFEDLQDIYSDFPISSAGARQVLESCLISLHQRMSAVWMRRAGDRYDWFNREFPSLAGRVPAKHIASFLGLTEVTFSILRNGREKWAGRE